MRANVARRIPLCCTMQALLGYRADGPRRRSMFCLARPVLTSGMPGAGLDDDPRLLLLESNNRTMRRAIATARQAAASDLPVLIVGESGTGKSTLAAAIHRWSPRREGPFVRLPCSSLGPSRTAADVGAPPT